MSVGKEQHLSVVSAYLDRTRKLEAELLQLKLLVRMVYRTAGDYASAKPWHTMGVSVDNATGRHVAGEHITDLIEQYESVNKGTL